MTIRLRAYEHRDYAAVLGFLGDIYEPDKVNRSWLPARWEFWVHHPCTLESDLQKTGLWEDGGRIVALAHCEDPERVYLQMRPECRSRLAPALLAYAEADFAVPDADGRLAVKVPIGEDDAELSATAEGIGYARTSDREGNSVFDMAEMAEELARKPRIPEGFTVRSLAEENDIVKLDRLLWRGFDHREPWDSVARPRALARQQLAPGYRKDLNIVVVGPPGDFVSTCGMWYYDRLKVAMVEPVATDPFYQRLGLGRAAVMEGVRRCAALGATAAYVGTDREFYLAIGFRRMAGACVWMKYL